MWNIELYIVFTPFSSKLADLDETIRVKGSEIWLVSLRNRVEKWLVNLPNGVEKWIVNLHDKVKLHIVSISKTH